MSRFLLSASSGIIALCGVCIGQSSAATITDTFDIPDVNLFDGAPASGPFQEGNLLFNGEATFGYYYPGERLGPVWMKLAPGQTETMYVLGTTLQQISFLWGNIWWDNAVIAGNSIVYGYQVPGIYPGGIDNAYVTLSNFGGAHEFEFVAQSEPMLVAMAGNSDVPLFSLNAVRSSPVPELSTWLMMAVGFLGLSGLLRSKARRI